MTLPVGSWVYGYIYQNNGVTGQVGATVNIVDQTNGQGTATTTTITDGFYQINIQNYVDDGDTIQVSAIYGGETNSDTFTLNIVDAAKSMNLTLETTARATFGFMVIPTVHPIKIIKSTNKIWVSK